MMKIQDYITELTSPEGITPLFKVIIETTHSETTSSHLFIVNSEHPNTKEIITLTYSLEQRDHNCYLDFFFKLSRDFDLRTPQNRKIKETLPSASTKYHPVLTQNLHEQMLYGYGDPAIIKVQQGDEICFYGVSTSNDAANSFPIIKSTDLVKWTFCTYVFPEGNKPDWTAEGENIADYWAPEMHQVGNEFWLYYVARDQKTRELCIGLAKATHPEGPFIAETQPILKGNVIDPHLYVEDEHNVYLFWKEDNNEVWPQLLVQFLLEHPKAIYELFSNDTDRRTASFIVTIWPWIKDLAAMERFFVLQILIEAVIEQYSAFEEKLERLSTENDEYAETIEKILKNMKTPMFVQKLSPDGRELEGEPIKILKNDLQWEAHLIEGMWVTAHNNKFYLFYAGNDFSTDQYGIGYAIADTITGPYKKAEVQLLQSTSEWWAPGHPSVVKNHEGKHLMFLHAYPPGKAGYKKFRALLQIGLKLNEESVTVET